jgi:hypothetical protein
LVVIIIIIIIITMIMITALIGPWPPQANVASFLYPGHAPLQFLPPRFHASFCTRQSILILVSHVLNLQGWFV